MKQLLLFILILFSMAAMGQSTTQILTGPTTKAVVKGGLEVDSALAIPQDTIMRANWPKTLPHIAWKGTRFYLWHPGLQKWQESGADSSIYATIFNVSQNYAPLTGYNKVNWDAAYSWGNHAGLYPLMSGSYSNPSWITSLAYSKLTGLPPEFTPSAASSYYIQNQYTAQQNADLWVKRVRFGNRAIGDSGFIATGWTTNPTVVNGWYGYNITSNRPVIGVNGAWRSLLTDVDATNGLSFNASSQIGLGGALSASTTIYQPSDYPFIFRYNSGTANIARIGTSISPYGIKLRWDYANPSGGGGNIPFYNGWTWFSAYRDAQNGSTLNNITYGNTGAGWDRMYEGVAWGYSGNNNQAVGIMTQVGSSGSLGTGHKFYGADFTSYLNNTSSNELSSQIRGINVYAASNAHNSVSSSLVGVYIKTENLSGGLVYPWALYAETGNAYIQGNLGLGMDPKYNHKFAAVGSVMALSGVARGGYFAPTLNPGMSGDDLVGVDIAPSFGTPAASGSIKSLSIVSGGSGLSNGTFQNVLIYGGTGTGARATVTVSINTVTSVTITNGGSGYTVGDIVYAAGVSQNSFSFSVTSVGAVTGVKNYALRVQGSGLTQIQSLATGGADQMVTVDSLGNLKKQVIPSGGTQVNSDWNATSGVSQILNKPSDLTGFTPRYTAGSGQGSANVTIPVSDLFTELGTISVNSNLTVGLSTSSTTGAKTLQKIIANTNTNASYSWQYATGTDVIKADGTVVTTIPNGKTQTLLWSFTQSKWILASEY